MVGRNAPSDSRLDVGGIDAHDVVELRIRIGGKGQPAQRGGVEVVHVDIGATLKIGDRLGVGIHISAARAAFDRHVANGHALFDRHAVEDIAGVFVGVADAAFGTEQADDVKDHILGVDSGAKVAIDFDAADFESLERKCLRGQHIAHLGGTDAKGDRTESSVRGGVRIAACDRGTRLGDALLGADDVDDALLARREVEISDAEVIGIFAQRLHHFCGKWVLWRVLVDRWHDVVDGGKSTLRELHLEAEVAKHAEGLRRSDLMDQVSADEELRATVGKRANGVGVPNFLEEIFSHGEQTAGVGGGRENCLCRKEMSKPHAHRRATGWKLRLQRSSMKSPTITPSRARLAMMASKIFSQFFDFPRTVTVPLTQASQFLPSGLAAR